MKSVECAFVNCSDRPGSKNCESWGGEVAVVLCDCRMAEYADKVVASLWRCGIKAYISDGDTLCPYIVTVGRAECTGAADKAEELLRGMGRASEYTEGSYIVYAEGRCVALAADVNEYTTYQPMAMAVEAFDGLLNASGSGKDGDLEKNRDTYPDIFGKNGEILSSGTVNLISEQRRLDDIEDEARWANVRCVIGDDDIYRAFRNMVESIFSKEMISLIASYYDPATGMFYASLSGKNAEGIYPIPEGVSQVLSYMVSTGMLRKTGKRYVIPELSKYKIVYYLKSIQCEDGQFYVSQMKKDGINSNRIGRDGFACNGLLWRLGAKPTYSNSKYDGDGITADEYWADLVSRGLVTEEEKPVIYWAEDPAKRREEVPADGNSSDKPTGAGTEQFQSHEGFIGWLLEKDPYNNPYSAISATSSASGLIAEWNGKVGEYEGADTVVVYEERELELKRGDTLYSILIRWLNNNMNEAGLFGKVTNDYDENGNPIYDGFFGGWGYQNSNGFLKGAARYTEAGGIKYPMPNEAIESLLKGINSDEVVTGNILVIYNVWSSLSKIKANISSFFEGEEREKLLEKISCGLTRRIQDPRSGEMKAYAAVAIEKCHGKLLTFKKRDGGFAHSVFSGTGGWQGGLKVGIKEDNLSDIDATNCSTSLLTNALCQFFGLELTRDVPMYNQADLLVFLDTMSKQEYVLKVGPMELEKQN